MNQRHPQRGAALLVALILMTAVAIVIASVVQSTNTEARLTAHSNLRMQADDAAEMLVDYALGDLARRMEDEVSFTEDEFSPSKNPFLIHDELRAGFDGMSIDQDSLALFGSKISTVSRFLIDPNDPANRFDTLKGKVVYVRYVDLYGRATATHVARRNVTAYTKLTVQLRDAPLFAHAIFYNMDLEFHPGPDMRIDGPVHANGNIWLLSGGSLYFEGIVTATKDIRVGLMLAGNQETWTTDSWQSGKNLFFRNASNEWQNLYRGSGATNQLGSYYTSLSSDFEPYAYESWREYATNEFGGNLQSGAHGVPRATPAGIADYVADETREAELQNHGYAIIEPNLALADPYHKGLAENQKFARKAGLILRVHRDLDGDGVDDDRLSALPAGAIRLRRRADPDDGWSSAARDFYTYWSEHPDDPYDPAVGPPHPSAYDSAYYLSLAAVRRADATNPNSALVLNSSTETIDLGNGETATVVYSEVNEDPVELSELFDPDQDVVEVGDESDELRARFDEAFAAHPYTEDATGNVSDGLYDQHVAISSTTEAKMSLVEINLAAFANIVEESESALFADYKPGERYNGVVYVEFPLDRSATPRPTDKIVRSVENLGLILTEAGGPDPALGRIPDPGYNTATGRDPGFTLATNNALYVRGHFNADGDFSTPAAGTSAFESDDPDDPDPPAALAADAITILSDNWRMANSTTLAPAAQSTEFCGALVAGFLPTNANGAPIRSGGSHNFHRFLENWGSRTLRYRGSMVAAFESEIQREPYNTRYYGPPNREYGFFREFSRGIYPPGTPSYQTYRKIQFQFLNAQEFSRAVDALGWSLTLPSVP